jgi:hypothetical protein
MRVIKAFITWGVTEEDKAQHTLKFLFLHLHSRAFNYYFFKMRVGLFEQTRKNLGTRDHVNLILAGW